MPEGLPLPVEVGVFGLGWTLFAACAWLFFRKLASGDLMTRREGDALVKRAETAEAANEKLLDQNGQLMDMARMGSATMQALRKAVEE